jgi:hypothetical protein
MRTDEKLDSIIADAKWFVKFHNKAVWVIPTKVDYILSVVVPIATDLPAHTSAIQYDANFGEINEVMAV